MPSYTEKRSTFSSSQPQSRLISLPFGNTRGRCYREVKIMGYICRECKRTSNLPDFCHGQAMLIQGSYVCDNCGRVSSLPGSCCGQEMSRV